MRPLPAARIARGLHRSRTLEIKRAQGRPDARRTRSPVCMVESGKRTRVIQVRRNIPAFPAQWLCSLWRALPGLPGLIATVPRARDPGLIPASGDQDHTLLPHASRIPRQMMQLASIASPPHVRDDAYAPLIEAGWRQYARFLIFVKRNFSQVKADSRDQFEIAR